MTFEVRLADEAFDPADALAEFGRRCPQAGAIVSFTGVARSRSQAGEDVLALHLESYRTVTLRSMEAIADAALARFSVDGLCVIHRHGRILPGEAIVFVATAGVHRRAAFQAADYLMDRLKSEAVFWKREDSPQGGRWIEPTEADRQALRRWHDPCAPDAS